MTRLTRTQRRRFAPLNRAFAAMCKRGVDIAIASPHDSRAGYEVFGAKVRDGKTYSMCWFVSDLQMWRRS